MEFYISLSYFSNPGENQSFTFFNEKVAAMPEMKNLIKLQLHEVNENFSISAFGMFSVTFKFKPMIIC